MSEWRSKKVMEKALCVAEGRQIQKEGPRSEQALAQEQVFQLKAEQRGQNEAQWLEQSEE